MGVLHCGKRIQECLSFSLYYSLRVLSCPKTYGTYTALFGCFNTDRSIFESLMLGSLMICDYLKTEKV